MSDQLLTSCCLFVRIDSCVVVVLLNRKVTLRSDQLRRLLAPLFLIKDLQS